MTPAELALIFKIRQQQVLGKGMFLEDEQFVQWAMQEYDLTREKLTELAKASI